MSLSKIVRMSAAELPHRAIVWTEIPAIAATAAIDGGAAELDEPGQEWDAESAAAQLDALSRAVLEKQREIADIEARALHLVAQAQEQAMRLLADAENTANALKVQAEEEGRAVGTREGRAEAFEQERGLIERAEAILTTAEKERQTRIRSAESFLVRLATVVARRIVERELETDEGYVARIAEELLAEAEKAHRVQLRVAPGNFAAALGERARFERLLPENGELSIVPDHTLAVGDAVVTTEYGTMDGRVRTRFDQVRTVLGRLAKEWEARGIDGQPS